MKNDIIPQKTPKPVRRPEQKATVPVTQPARRQEDVKNSHLKMPELPTLDEPFVDAEKPKKRRLKRHILGGIPLVIIGIVVTVSFLLSPLSSSAESDVSVEIVSGMVPGQIADALHEDGIIRSPLAFLLYTRLTGAQDSLQAGTYDFSPTDSVPEIVSQLQAGPYVDEIEVTFKPGATLSDNKQELLAVGYSEVEIDTAFSAEYDHPLLEGKPAGADLEGYLFGETHRFVIGTPIKTILERYFDDYYAVVSENNLIERYKQQGLSLFEGITLASIVQRESGGEDKAQIAQIFLLRLSSGMELGSDVTYQYIADKEGKPRDVNYDSPYNTRRYTGLPPGPIATPGVAALKAVGSPASGDYLYFLSGDDNITYFARTFAEHEANIRDHCQEKCKII